MKQQPNDTVSASEIADFAYCPEAWRLARIGHESVNQLSRDSGTRHHASKAAAERVAGGSIALGRLLILVALLALLAAFLWR